MEKLIAINAVNYTQRNFLHILGDESKRKKNVKRKGKHFNIQRLKYSEAACYSLVSNKFCWEMGRAREQSQSETGEKHPQLSIASEQITTPTGFSFLPGEHKANPSLVWPLNCCYCLSLSKKKCLVSQDSCTKLVHLFKPFSLRMIVEKF